MVRRLPLLIVIDLLPMRGEIRFAHIITSGITVRWAIKE